MDNLAGDPTDKSSHDKIKIKLNPENITERNEIAKLNFEIASGKKEKRGEDRIYPDAKEVWDRKTAIICDGMGGRPLAGEAAEIALNSLKWYLGEYFGNEMTTQNAQDQMNKALIYANENIKEFNKLNNVKHQREQWRHQTEISGELLSGTTVSALKFYQDIETSEERAIIGNVADSRVYKFNPQNSELECLTLDRISLVNESGSGIETVYQQQESLAESESEAELNGRNLVAHPLDGKDFTPYIIKIAVNPGDRLIITSDGIHDNLKNSEIREIIKNAKSSDEAKTTLLKKADERSKEEGQNPRAKPDDMSAIVIYIHKS